MKRGLQGKLQSNGALASPHGSGGRMSNLTLMPQASGLGMAGCTWTAMARSQ